MFVDLSPFTGIQILFDMLVSQVPWHRVGVKKNEWMSSYSLPPFWLYSPLCTVEKCEPNQEYTYM